jgi:selT/selW/selH-like putative selenoprotein
MLKSGSHEVTLVEGGGGVFEIRIDERLAFSKKSCGRFPQPDEIDSLLR